VTHYLARRRKMAGLSLFQQIEQTSGKLILEMQENQESLKRLQKA